MFLESVRTDKFCFCCDLRTGCIVTAVLGWFITTCSIFTLYNELEKYGDQYIGFIPRLTSNIIGVLIAFVLCLMLIMAVLKRNLKIMKLIIILKGIECIIFALVFIFLLLAILLLPVKLVQILHLLTMNTIFLVLGLYFWICIWSLYLDYVDDEEDYYDRTGPETDKLNNFETSNC